MHKLCVKLPPFSPDYSGVCSALFELGGLLVIHDASGCTGNYTGYDEPRWYGSTSMVYCSSLREMDAVMGDDEKLINKIVAAAEKTNPRFIGVLGSPVPMVIGSDFDGIASEIAFRTGIPSFGFSTTGLHYYDWGIDEAFRRLAKHIITPPKQTLAKSVNILGATPLDFSINGDIDTLKDMLKEQGYQVLSCFAMGSTIEELAESAQAERNLVISSSGLGLAKYMEKQYQIPYIWGLPIGDKGSDAYFAACTHKSNDCDVIPQSNCNYEKHRILILHEQMIAHAIRQCLRHDFGLDCPIDIGAPFAFSPALAEKDDKALKSEKEIAQALNNSYSIVIGDPLYKQLIKDSASVHFIDLPHVAVSSKLYWDHTPNLMGANGKQFFAHTLGPIL